MWHFPLHINSWFFFPILFAFTSTYCPLPWSTVSSHTLHCFLNKIYFLSHKKRKWYAIGVNLSHAALYKNAYYFSHAFWFPFFFLLVSLINTNFRQEKWKQGSCSQWVSSCVYCPWSYPVFHVSEFCIFFEFVWLTCVVKLFGINDSGYT